MVGWLGFGVYQVEEAIRNAATVAPQGNTLASIEVLTADVRPIPQLVAAGAGTDESQWQATPVLTEEANMGKVLDVGPTPNVSTLVGGIHTMLQGAGHSEWSTARLQGVLGHAFSFVMNEGAGKVEHVAGLDWGTPPKGAAAARILLPGI